MRRRRLLNPLARLVVGLFLLSTLPTTADAATPSQLPVAVSVPGLPTVGPLFRNGIGQQHVCTASVLQSPRRDLILTAAHCISGTGAGVVFVPGYDTGSAPFGYWVSTAAYVDPSWLARQDPQHDYAILRLARQVRQGRSVGVQDVVGGGNIIALAPLPGQLMMVPAYPAGIRDRPIDCAVTAYLTDGYPSFDCAGYVGGTSGAPWLIRTPSRAVSLVAGVIGGLHQGGCVDYTSYSSAFTLDTYRLWLRASVGAPPDLLPTPGPDGC
jgi:V8-like Glu-specific endopeptidase